MHPLVNAFLLPACLHTLQYIFTAPVLSVSVTSHGNLENQSELKLLEHRLSVLFTLVVDEDEDGAGSL